jgi:hypothetical protein
MTIIFTSVHITIKPFAGDESDRELQHLLVYLDILKGEKDIRRIEKRGWRDKIVT